MPQRPRTHRCVVTPQRPVGCASFLLFVPVERVVERVVEKPVPASSEAGDKAWLVFGLPSVPRRNNVDYLSATIDFILDQLPADPSHPLFGKVSRLLHGTGDIWLQLLTSFWSRGQVKIVVMNNAKGKEHKVFDENRRRLDPAQHPKGSYVVFMENPNPPMPTKRQSHSANVPSPRVRHTSRGGCRVVADSGLGLGGAGAAAKC